MPYFDQSLALANQTLGGPQADPAALGQQLAGVNTVLEGAEALGLPDAVGEYAAPLRAYLDSFPPSIDAAIVASLRSALARGLRAQIIWQPAYHFEVQASEVTDLQNPDAGGMLTIQLRSPHPPEPGYRPA